MSSPYEPRPYPGTWRSVRSGLRRRWTVPLHFIEWLTRLWAYYLSHWALLEILEYAGRFTVLVAVIVYFSEAPDRRIQKHFQAWQVINSAVGKSGNGGRLEAMQELNEDNVSLVAVDVSTAFLQGVQLPGADLHYATMNACDLRNCNLHGANLSGANLRASNFRNGDLHDANAQAADLFNTDLTGADLAGADLSRADLRNADLGDVKWKQIASIRLANIFGVDHPPQGFVAWAMKNGAVSIKSDDAWEAKRNGEPQAGR